MTKPASVPPVDTRASHPLAMVTAAETASANTPEEISRHLQRMFGDRRRVGRYRGDGGIR